MRNQVLQKPSAFVGDQSRPWCGPSEFAWWHASDGAIVEGNFNEEWISEDLASALLGVDASQTRGGEARSALTHLRREEADAKLPERWEVSQSRRSFTLRNESARSGNKQLTASQTHGVIFQEDFMEREGQAVVRVIHGADSQARGAERFCRKHAQFSGRHRVVGRAGLY
jgi:hypothetical protein